MEVPIQIRILGPLQIAGADAPRARQQRVILAALAAVWPERLTADRLIDGLWPGDAPKDALKALQVLVARLRKQLSPVGLDIRLDPGGYLLDVGRRAIDAQVFRALCIEEQELPHSLDAQRQQLLEQALSLFAGEPFAGLLDEPLIDEARNDLILQWEDATARLHQVRLDRGQMEGLLPDLVSWANQRPLDEGAWSRLAVGLHYAGRPTEALRTLHLHRQTVREHAGVEPTSAIAELEARLLADDADQVAAGKPGNLRVPRRSFLGRAREVRELATLLEAGRALTLVGPAGVGKTTLALHLAGGVASKFRDGVWVCEFADIETGDAVIEALASTLGVRQQRGQTLLKSVVNGFRHAQALIIADNCEHLREPIVELVSALTAECPDLTVLATSRESLALQNERVHPVQPLNVTDAEDDEPGGPAFDLFVQRARESGADLTVDRANSTTIAEICRQLDGLPLAIELAASRTRSMSVTEIGIRLDERFRILGHNHHDGPRRQRTLWDAVDWSYQLLDDSTQRLFDRLSVFLGGFTARAAREVADDPGGDVEQAVWTLVEQSMLVPSPGRDGTTRYQMLETLRQYGEERLRQRGALIETRDLHLGLLTEIADHADNAIRGPNEARSVRQLTDELANLRSAHRHAIATSQFDHAARLVTSLHDYAIWRQFFELGSWAEATLPLSPATTRHHPTLLATAGWGRCIAGDYDVATAFAREGLDLEAAAQHECGWLHDILAHCAYFQGDGEAGLAHGDAEIRRARASGDSHRLSYVLADNGTHATLLERHDLAAPRSQEALDLANRTGNAAAVSMAQLAMGFLHRDRDPHESITWFQQGAQLADTVDSSWTAGICRGELSLLLSLHGDPYEAVSLALTQFLIFRRAGDAGRVRSCIRMVIPALHKVLDERNHPDLVTLDSGTFGRPQIREPFIDTAVNQSIDLIDAADSEAAGEARSRGGALGDDAVFDLALELMETAIRPPATS